MKAKQIQNNARFNGFDSSYFNRVAVTAESSSSSDFTRSFRQALEREEERLGDWEESFVPLPTVIPSRRRRMYAKQEIKMELELSNYKAFLLGLS